MRAYDRNNTELIDSNVCNECWAITDQAAGNQRQALALAERLGLPVRHLILEPNAPWSWLAPRLSLGGRFILPVAQRPHFAPPWPRIAIGCGRTAALFTRMLRPLSRGGCHTVQILDPRINPRHWEVVIAPRHDGLLGDHVLTPLGSLNPIDDAWLAQARDAFTELSQLPQPRLGVLLGGPRRGIAFDATYASALASHLRRRQAYEGGSLLVLASRRTPAVLIESLQSAIGPWSGLLWRNHSDGPNPYPGVLAWSDRLLVTPDSVNMLSEACATGLPLETLVTTPLPTRIRRFHLALQEAGYLPSSKPHAPLRETETIAAVLRATWLQVT